LFGEKSWNVFIKKKNPLISFRLKKECHGYLGWHGGE